MTYRVFASGDRTPLRMCAAIDRSLGYPRTHADDEPGVSRLPGRPAPYTETHTRPLRHLDGRTAIAIDDAITALHGQQVDVEDGGTRRVTIDATPTDAELPDGRDAWSSLPPRGGIAAAAALAKERSP